MNNIIEHLRKNGVDVFQVHELNEPLMLTYKILSWAVRDQADTLLIDPRHVEWYKKDILIDKFQPTALIPVLTFPVILKQIIDRDPIVNRMLKLISNEDKRTIYKIVV